MTVFLDHLAATLVGLTVLVALAALGLSSQTDGVTAASGYALRQQVESFGDVVQTDLESLSAPISLDAATGAFAFRARITPHDTTQHVIRYVLEAAGERGGEPVFRLVRMQDGVATGGSADILRGWSATALAADGTPALTEAEVARVHVALDTVAPFLPSGTDDAVQSTTRWEATVTPIILHYNTF